ncbi:MAG: protein kinase [candidate division Zixibacteria bacterium]|nr:protein kinase [candidate division Zixibacteria bacterium]MCI0596857.1 protein kinase [candidate division Zixibacteria bacterium]
MNGPDFAHYKIIKKLGAGGMGEVYLAEDTKLARKAALKLMGAEQTIDPDVKKRFLQEAQAAAALNHPNIITIYEVGEFLGRAYIAMEYVEGRPLKDLIVVQGLSVDQLLDFAIQIGEGLAKAHQAGIVHCDIKSDNILIDGDGRAKILDFGLAQLKGVSGFGPDTTAGTPGYMSPEQIEGGALDARTDIFSFGVVLYEMAASRPPFTGAHPAAVVYSILNESPPPLTRSRPEIPNAFQAVVDRALAKNREERFASAAELVSALKACKKELEEPKKGKKEKKAVAVLYFENLSQDPDSDYFCAGMTEDIITDLSKIESVRVASRNAVLPYKDKPVDVLELGKNLSLNAVLQGSFRKLGNRIRISAQLIDAAEGFNLWAERYDRELTEVFALQEEIAKNIASALKIQLSDRDEEKMALKYKNNLEAYDHYLKGRNYFYKYTKPDLLTAVQMFKKALETDPNYALAYAGLADSYVQMIDRYYETDKKILRKGEESAQKALEIDPLCAEACKALGLVYYKQAHYRKAKEQFLKALELKPGFAPAHSNLASTCIYLGDFERAEREYLVAYEEDPSLTFVLWLLARLYLSLNRFSEAENYVQKVMASGESSFHLKIGYYLLSRTCFYRGQFEPALAYMQKYVEVEPGEPFGDSALASLYAALGQAEKARAKIADTLKNAPWDEDIIENLILAWWLLGEKENLYDWIRKGMAENKIVWVFLERNPLLEKARGEPAFQELLRELKGRTLGATI